MNKGLSEALSQGRVNKFLALKIGDIRSKVDQAVSLGQIPPDLAEDCVQEASLTAWIGAMTDKPLAHIDADIGHTVRQLSSEIRETILHEVPLDHCHQEVVISDDRIAAQMEIPPVVATIRTNLRQVLTLRFGIGSEGTYSASTIDHNMTLDEVGEVIGTGRENVRQLESKGLLRLRHPSRTRRLQDIDY